MGKEAGQKHDQGPLSQTMRELEAKNAKVGGTLFSTVGKGEKKAFLFPTYVTRQEGEETVNEFLVVTPTRVKAIQVSNFVIDNIPQWMKGKGIARFFTSPSAMSQSIIEAKDGRGYNVKGKDGERLKFMVGDLELRIGALTSRRTGDWLNELEAESYRNCRLVNPNEEQVKEMLAANMERVKATQAAAQKVNAMLG